MGLNQKPGTRIKEEGRLKETNPEKASRGYFKANE